MCVHIPVRILGNISIPVSHLLSACLRTEFIRLRMVPGKCDHNLDPWRDDPEVSSGDEYGEDEQDEEVSFSLLILLVQYL